MSEEIVFYYNPMSRARITHWMLEEVGAPYRVELISFEKGEHKKPEFLALNPMGKLPAIVHRGVVVTEAAAICAYLADAFPNAKLAPAADDPARGTYLRWLFFAAGCVEPALTDRANSRPTVRAAVIGYGTYADVVASLERAITPGPYILGDRFSAADVYVGSHIAFGMLMMKTLDPTPTFQAYVERLSARPAYKRFNEQSAHYMAQMKAAG